MDLAARGDFQVAATYFGLIIMQSSLPASVGPYFVKRQPLDKHVCVELLYEADIASAQVCTCKLAPAFNMRVAELDKDF